MTSTRSGNRRRYSTRFGTPPSRDRSSRSTWSSSSKSRTPAHLLTRNRVSGTIERHIAVAPIPGGHTDEPPDLGTMPLNLEVRNSQHVVRVEAENPDHPPHAVSNAGAALK